MKKPRWFKNTAGTMSTIVRPGIALSPAEFRWLEKKSKEDGQSIAEVLYHLTKAAIDKAMINAGEWCE